MGRPAKKIGIVLNEYFTTPTDAGIRQWKLDMQMRQRRFGKNLTVYQGQSVEWFGKAPPFHVWIRIPGEQEKRKVPKNEVQSLSVEEFTKRYGTPTTGAAKETM